MNSEDIQEKISEASSRQVRTVKPTGTGNTGHTYVPQSIAEIGDRILIIRLDDKGMTDQRIERLKEIKSDIAGSVEPPYEREFINNIAELEGFIKKLEDDSDV